MPSTESLQRGTRAKKESFILEEVRLRGKVKATELYGSFSRKFPGAAIRTFLNEYLPAMEYRGEIVLRVKADGYFAYVPEVLKEEEEAKKI